MNNFTHDMKARLRQVLILGGAVSLTLGQMGIIALAAETHHISQKSRAFDVPEITVSAGDVIQFANDDDFIHQIYVASPTFNFDTPESAPGNSINIKFTTPGTFEVHCHIHPKMRLTVHVQQ